jgi:hypothetical protein
LIKINPLYYKKPPLSRMNNSNRSVKKNLGYEYPGLLVVLAAIAYHARELHSLTASINDELGVSRQNFEYHVQKVAKKKGGSK